MVVLITRVLCGAAAAAGVVGLLDEVVRRLAGKRSRRGAEGDHGS